MSEHVLLHYSIMLSHARLLIADRATPSQYSRVLLPTTPQAQPTVQPHRSET